MARAVCPWWLGYFLASGLRRLVQDPAAILGPYVTEGMVVFEPGPGMGHFTLELARRVGSRGKVVAVDVQPRMIETLRRRAEEAGLAGGVALPSEAVAESIRPFENLPALPRDLSEAFEGFKLAILNHKLAGWREVGAADVLTVLDALKQLVLARS